MPKLCIGVLSLLLLVTPAYAVDVFKVSQYGGGHQIWFEGEAFDARDPDSENKASIGYKLADAETGINPPDGAFGDVMVNVAGNDRIWLRYDFDISKCDGKGGRWYLWCRMINPNNRSEWLWVLGDDGDEIPDGKPAFIDGDDRVFEATIGPPWGWACSHSEGDVKDLQDGENTMMIWFREGDTTGLRDVLVWCDNATYRPSDDDYTNAGEIKIKLSVGPAGKLSATWGMIKGE